MNTLNVPTSSQKCTYSGFHENWTGRTQDNHLTDLSAHTHTLPKKQKEGEPEKLQLDLLKHFIMQRPEARDKTRNIRQLLYNAQK